MLPKKSSTNDRPADRQIHYRGQFPFSTPATCDSLNSLATTETDGPPPLVSTSSTCGQPAIGRPWGVSSGRQSTDEPTRRRGGGGSRKTKSCSTELDDESLSPDDSADGRSQLLGLSQPGPSSSSSTQPPLSTSPSQPRPKQLNRPAGNGDELTAADSGARHQTVRIDYEHEEPNDEDDDIGGFDERSRLMSSAADDDARRRNRTESVDDLPKSTLHASGSILLPSTTVGTSSTAATNRNFLNDEDDGGGTFVGGERQASVSSSYGGGAIVMSADPQYAVRSSGGGMEGSDSRLPPRLRMGRRFTLNPLIFAKEERDARRQSLAQLKLSYYPTNAHPDVYDAGLGFCSWSLLCLSWIVILLTFPISVCFCIKVVQEYERAVIFRLGRLIGGGARGPGIFFVMPCVEHYTKVDLRTVSFSVPPQEILTRDSVTVSVDAVVYYRVSNATVSVANVENAHHSTRLLAQTTLRNMLGMQNLSEILSGRDNLANVMQTLLDDATESWGIKVERVEIKDVRLPIQLQRAMAAEAEATREARAKVIAAEGEQKASRSLREAARIIALSPAAIQLRYLQTLSSVAAEKNSTIIFPLPIELIRHFINRNDGPPRGQLTNTISG